MYKFFKKIICTIFIFGLFQPVFAETITGNIEKNEKFRKNRVVDADTKRPVPFATIRIPMQNYQTKSDNDGFFKLNADMTGTTIMSVEKDGYRPFSVTVNEDSFSKPIIIGIEKTQATDLSIESDVIHIGDNKFSKNSANSSEFKLRSVGPYYSKSFKISTVGHGENVYFVIGSVIGVDTLLSRQMGQSRVTTAYASPAQIYFNGQKIGEIKFNSDGQSVKLPKQLIRQNGENEITIRAGKNLFKSDSIDYDDIEMANLHIEFKSALAND